MMPSLGSVPPITADRDAKPTFSSLTKNLGRKTGYRVTPLGDNVHPFCRTCVLAQGGSGVHINPQ